MPRFVLAVDPDIKTPAFAGVAQDDDGRYRVSYLGVGRVPPGKTDTEVAPTLSALALAQALRQVPLRPVGLAVVEGQAIYSHVRQKPQDILKLGQAAGACAGLLLAWGYSSRMVDPADWKGQVPKHVSQGRAFKKLGWTNYEKRERKEGSFLIPSSQHLEGVAAVNMDRLTDWKHVGDAVALAVWGLNALPWFRSNSKVPSPPTVS